MLKLLSLLLAFILGTSSVNLPFYESKVYNGKWKQDIEMFDNVKFESSDENIMFSPMSLNYALLMAGKGAKGKTYDEFNNYFENDMDSKYKAYSDYITNLDKTVEIANSFWYSNEYKAKADYVNMLKNNLNAEISAVDFLLPKTVIDINSWANTKTHGMIPSIVQQIPPETVSMLINAIYFKNNWMEQFEPYNTYKDKVTTNNGDVQVDMMHGEAEMYLENENATGFIKKYEGGRYGFVAIRPNDNKTYKSLAGMNVENLLASAQNVETHISMPNFTFENEMNLTSRLQDMGITTAFGDLADFSNMGDMPISISSVLQKSKIELTESGTEAAAVTAIIFDNAAIIEKPEPKVVDLDKPFYFIIMDLEYDEPLFMGYVSNPQGE